MLMPLVIIGGGGHASVLVDLLRNQNRTILAVMSPDDISTRQAFDGIMQLSNDKDISRYSPDEVRLVNGIGMMPKSLLRRKVNQYFLDLGYQFETVISDQALVSKFAHLQDGAQILKGAIVQCGAVIGEHSIINTGAVIEHDTVVGEHNHIALEPCYAVVLLLKAMFMSVQMQLLSKILSWRKMSLLVLVL